MKKCFAILLLTISLMLFCLSTVIVLADTDMDNQDQLIMPLNVELLSYEVEEGKYIYYYPEWGEITDCDNDITELIIPSQIGDVIITSIGRSAFENRRYLHKVVIPDTIISIGNSAFAGSGIYEIIIPESVTSIGVGAFSNCRNLKSINIPNSIYIINDDTFSECSSLQSITIPDSVTSIGSNAFYYCSGLTDVILGNGITEIGYEAFYECYSLQSITIPDSVTSIGKNAFYYCSGLTDVILGNGVKEIGSKAFSYCSGLENITIPKNLTIIGDSVFSNCDNLTRIIIPGNVKTIGKSAFYDCDSLLNVIIENGVQTIEGGAFADCARLTGISLPSSITEIYGSTFNGCWRLSEILVDENNPNYTSVNGILFNKDKTKLIRYPEGLRNTSYTIPDTVNSIDEYAFYGCSYLTDIWFAGSERKWQKISAGCEIPENINIHCLGTDDEDSGDDDKPGFGGGGTSSNVSIATMVTGSRVTISPSRPSRGQTVTIHVTPADGYKLDTLKVTDSNDNEIEVTKISDDKYTFSKYIFTMPAGRVMVTPAFVKIDISSDNNPTIAPMRTLTFNPNGGTITGTLSNGSNTSSVQVRQGTNYYLPTAVKSGYIFQNWTDGQNSYKANNAYRVEHDTTLTAVWTTANFGGSSGGSGGSSKPNSASNSGTTTKPSSTSNSGTTTKPSSTSNSGTTTKPSSTSNSGTTTKPSSTITPNAADNNRAVTAQNINNTFSDVQNNVWYSEAIAYVYNNGMMNGTEKGFEPNANTTRAMLVTMLFRLEGQPAADATNFSDVANGQWFSQAIAWAAAQGVVNGYADGRFGTNEAITREQLATILYRYAQMKGENVNLKGNLQNFNDSSEVSAWAVEAMQWAVGAGIVNGDDKGVLNPSGNATRAEVAMMLMRFLEK